MESGMTWIHYPNTWTEGLRKIKPHRIAVRVDGLKVAMVTMQIK
jgi:hypothetical protein